LAIQDLETSADDTDETTVDFLDDLKIPYVVLLAVAAALVSTIGATFSVTGLAKLFAGAPHAIMFMAASLEFSKLVSAGFLHQNWSKLSYALRFYLSVAVVLLMAITSLGIFGYLSHAYQKSAVGLKSVEFKIETLQNEDRKIQDEVARIQKTLDEVPPNRVSKRMELQKELEPEIQRFKRRAFEINTSMQALLLERQGYQTEVGPLVYVAEAMKQSMDSVARWLILLFVCVFDPLAICLVFATSWSLKHMKAQEEAARQARMKASTLKAVEPPQVAA
jgi:hypothetical protein